MKLAYLDCSSGISGDMFLGALLDAGLSAAHLTAELRKLSIGEYEFKVARVLRAGLAGTHVEIHAPRKQPERHLDEIEDIIGNSSLTEGVKQRAVRAFRRLADVEGRLHDKPPQKVHFHEVGAVDAVLDITGACVGLELLGIAELVCSPLNLGCGRVSAAHGSLPVPAPATAELLRRIPVYSSGIQGELVTPTGAVIVSELASSFGPMPAMKIESIGYGAGTRDVAGHPNLARLFVGEKAGKAMGLAQPDAAPGRGERQSADMGHTDEIVSVIQSNLDDMSPQLYGYLVERALTAGALDISCSSIQMKKNRPGLELTILCRPELTDALARLLFDETTTIGVRIYEARRKVLERQWANVETPFGSVRVKVARRNGRVMNVTPEYEDCHRLAAEKAVPLKEVMLAAQVAYAQQSPKP